MKPPSTQVRRRNKLMSQAALTFVFSMLFSMLPFKYCVESDPKCYKHVENLEILKEASEETLLPVL